MAGRLLTSAAVLFAWMLASAPLVAATGEDPVEPVPPQAICRQIVADHVGPDQGDASAMIQRALGQCRAGTMLKLVAGMKGGALVSGPLQLPPGVSLWLDRGFTLYASRNPRDYDRGQGVCGHTTEKGGGCRALISLDHGHDQGLYGEGVIDGQGGQPMPGTAESWWQLARRAQREHREENAPRLIQIRQSRDIVLDRLTLRNAPNFHVSVSQSDGFTAWGLFIDTPGDARNTDGIDPASSSHVLLAHNWINTGDDNVAIKAGPTGPSRDITIIHNHFYQGHGLSIGSEVQSGVSDVRVDDLSLDGTTNGLRIKSDRSRGGRVEDIVYSHVCMRHVRWPLVLDTAYAPDARGSALPVFRAIRFEHVHALDGGDTIWRGLDAGHPLQVSWQDVQVEGGTVAVAQHLQLTLRGGAAGPLPQGVDVRITGRSDGADGQDCRQAFPVFPGRPPEVPSAAAGGRDRAQGGQATLSGPGPDLEVGPGHEPTVAAAVAAAPAGAVIRIAPGIYHERLSLDTPGLQLIGTGSSPDAVRIVAATGAGEAGGTSKTATVFARAAGIRISHLSIENAFSRLHPDVRDGAQAVALAASGDGQRFDHLHLIGYQDTLYAGSAGCAGEQGPCRPARQIYADSRIDGAVDVIFGDALAYFDHDELHGVLRRQVTLTAQSRRYPAQASGYVFDHCRISADPSVVSISLGRPWRAYATVVYIDSLMDGRVLAAGFTEWTGRPALRTATYAEYGSRGPGARTQGREAYEQVPGRLPPRRWRPPALFAPGLSGLL